jgi:serine/threonine-protein kinase
VQLGRYAMYGEIASGGMATVHLGMLIGHSGFSHAVAIKKLHPPFAKDPDFVAMFLDEGRLAARIRHPNVVPTLDVVATGGELFLVMEYVQGDTLGHLVRIAIARRERIPPSIVSGIMIGALQGLHAAHEAKDERGEPLDMVHRDFSPQNIMVGIDGVARVLDFGVAKAAGRSQVTRSGQLKGKLGYMSPEQISGGDIDRRTDTYAATIVLWEALVCRRLYGGENDGEVFAKVVKGGAESPSRMVPNLGTGFDVIVVRGLAKNPEVRFQTARDMALAISRAAPPATAFEIGEWVERLASDELAEQARRIAELESGTASRPRTLVVASVPPPAVPPSGPEPSAASSGVQPAQMPTAPVALPAAGTPPALQAPTTAPAVPNVPPDEMPTVIFEPSPNVPPDEMRTVISEPSSAIEMFVMHTRDVVRRRRIVIGAVALAGIVGTIVLLVSLLRPVEPEPSTVSPDTPAASAATPAPSSAEEPVPTTTGPPSTPAPTQPPPPAPATGRAPVPQPVPRRPAADPCNPPYWVDSHGVKHYKAQCM